MSFNNQNDVIKTEIDAIINDIKKVYNSSGKRVSGKFEEMLEARYRDGKAEVWGVTYLAGRGRTKNGNKGEPTLVEQIKEWIINKGIVPLEKNLSISSLAFLIARKIHREGTSERNHLKIYQQIITPERIDSIIKKVSVFNVNNFINEIEVSLTLLQKDK